MADSERVCDVCESQSDAAEGECSCEVLLIVLYAVYYMLYDVTIRVRRVYCLNPIQSPCVRVCVCVYVCVCVLIQLRT